MVTAPLMVPPAEFESAAFCSASKRSIQLRYEGLGLTVGILYRSVRRSSSAQKRLLKNNLITSIQVSPGNAYDGHFLQGLIKKDCQQAIPVGIVAADRGYDDSRNHFHLSHQGIQSAICLNTYRTHKKDANKEVWLEMKANPAYQQGLDERYKIERKFGESKQQHGLGRCRYRGLERYAMQALLTAMALNLKRMVKLLYGVNFRNPAPVMA